MNYRQSSYSRNPVSTSTLNTTPGKTSRAECHLTHHTHSSSNDRFNYIHYCYTKEAVRNLDYLMVQEGQVKNSYELMTRAASRLLDFINRNYPRIEHITIFCGAGNNAGDGYVLARLAKEQEKEPHLDVQLIAISNPEQLSGDAKQACQDWLTCGGTIDPVENAHFQATDLIVDALIGTGLNRTLENEWYSTIAAINNATVPVLSVDIPSGLDANTGSVHGIAVKANDTVTFIAQKLGMYTAQARHYCGKIHFSTLGVDESLYNKVEHSAVLMEWADIGDKLPCRSPVSNKGDNGHILIIGGDYGMGGACRIAGEAALRAGAGLVSIATRKENVSAITGSRPELMVHGIEHPDELDPLLKKANAIAIGPGLGTEQWGIALLDKITHYLKHLPDSAPAVYCVIDADALNIMAKHNVVIQNPDIIYTPHFGEACRLLKYASECPSEDTDRFAIIRALKDKYHGTFILKGAGTLIQLQDDIAICPYGNEGMASAGMGDCLTGIMAALLGQGLSVSNAAQVGVCLHAKAGDLVAMDGKNGMIVSDLFPKIRQILND